MGRDGRGVIQASRGGVGATKGYSSHSSITTASAILLSYISFHKEHL